MHRIRKEEGQQTKKQGLLPILFPWGICSLFLKRSVQYIAIYVFNFSIPLLFCVFSYLGKEIFHEGKAVYVGIFLMFFLPHTKLIFPCMQGDLNKSHTRNIFVGYKWKFTFQTKPLWGFATVWCLESSFRRKENGAWNPLTWQKRMVESASFSCASRRGFSTSSTCKINSHFKKLCARIYKVTVDLYWKLSLNTTLSACSVKVMVHD